MELTTIIKEYSIKDKELNVKGGILWIIKT